MDYKVFIPVLISFVLSVILGPLVIPVLRRLKMDQTEREDGVQSHLKKAGTPTMGGVMILLAVVITSVIYIGRYPKIIPMYAEPETLQLGVTEIQLSDVTVRCNETFGRIISKAEDGTSDRGNSNLCILYGEICRGSTYNADSF